MEGEAGEETDEEERRKDHHETMMLCPGLREAAFFSSFSYCCQLDGAGRRNFPFLFLILPRLLHPGAHTRGGAFFLLSLFGSLWKKNSLNVLFFPL